jgi:hypothetical protein
MVASPTELSHLFKHLSESDSLWGNVPNRAEVTASIPASFKSAEPVWRALATHLLGSPLTHRQVKALETNLVATEDAAANQLLYLRAWMNDFETDSQEKVTVVAWLLSLMLRTVPEIDSAVTTPQPAC